MRRLVLLTVIATWGVGIPLGATIAQQTQQPGAPPSASTESGAQPKQAGAQGPQVPDANQLVILIRSTLLAVNHANLTGNYTVLRELGTPGFQQSNNPVRLADVFRGLRERNLDIGPIAVLDAKLRRQPSLDANGQLRLIGFFPSRPEQVNFDLVFYKRNGRWLLDGIALNTTPSQAARPAPSKASSASNVRAAPKTPATAAIEPPVASANSSSSPSQQRPVAKKTNPGVEERVEMLEASPPRAKAKRSESKTQGWNPFSRF